MANLAIIPARGGSKRIPGKNIKSFLGKPIIAYSIEAAIKSELFDEVMVSTDSEEIAEIARSFGAKAPFFRNEKTSDDYAVLSDVIEEVLIAYNQIGKMYDCVCCILPTAPFITPEKLINAYTALMSENRDSILPVVEFSFPIQRAFQIKNGKLAMVLPEFINARSQDIDARYHDAGQFYFIKTKSFLEEKKLFTSNSGAIIISQLQAQDIDTENDWKLAELKYRLYIDEEENHL